jgi:hypothetical protein
VLTCRITIKPELYQRVHLEYQGEKIEYQIREKKKQIRRPLTEDEKRWSSYAAERGWIQELQPTGALIFTIKTYLANGMRHEWKDEPDRPLENSLPDIVATLSLAGPYLVKQRKDRLEAEKRRWQEDQRRHIERQERERDQDRWRKFLEFARQKDEAASVRRLLVELKAQAQPEGHFGGRSAVEWLTWADQWLENFDPLLRGPENLYRNLGEVQART